MLDITLTAHDSSQVIEVAGSDPSKPGVQTLLDGFMTFAWTVYQGAASNGQSSGDGYPSPTLHVNPSDTLRIHLANPVHTFEDLSQLPVDQHRTVFFKPDNSDPNNPRFLINGQTFPNAPVFQPRAGPVEEWTIVNEDTIPHPLHIYLQRFQAEARTGTYVLPDGRSVPYDSAIPHPYDQDVFDIEPRSATVVRIQWRPNLIGEAVFHCHNLFHEDGGMMALLNVIPNNPQIAAVPTTSGPTARFFDLNAAGTPVGNAVASVTPFGVKYRGGMEVALGDVNGDGIPDIIVSGANGSRPFVRAYSGRTGTLLADFAPFESPFRGGVNIAAADVDGSGLRRIITTPGQGHAPTVRVRGWDLSRPNGSSAPTTPLLGTPTLVDEFLAGDASDRRGLDVTTTSYNAAAGGFFRIVTAPATAARDVTVWNPLSGMNHDAMAMDMGMSSGMGGTTATAMTTLCPNARGVARNGFALGSINTATGSLIVVGSRDAVRRGAGNPLRFFDAGAGGMAMEVGNVNPGLGRAGLSLGGS